MFPSGEGLADAEFPIVSVGSAWRRSLRIGPRKARRMLVGTDAAVPISNEAAVRNTEQRLFVCSGATGVSGI